jgi:prevent-host-death family protein
MPMAKLAKMRRATVSHLKNRLSEFLRLVKRGQTIEVVERGIPIARIQPILAGEGSGDERLQRLVVGGVVAQGRRPLDLSWLKEPPVVAGVDPVRVLIEERGER